MSVIVFDGETLATDNAGNDGVCMFPMEKLWIGPNGVLCAACGYVNEVGILRRWCDEGMLREKYPTIAKSSSATLVIVSKEKGLLRYTSNQIPTHHGFNKVAFGSGRDFAYGALFAGGDAICAVEAAIEYSTTCGLGVSWKKLTKQEQDND